MNGEDINTVIDLVVLGAVGGLWFRLGALLQGQQDNRRRMGDIEARLSSCELRLVNVEEQT